MRRPRRLRQSSNIRSLIAETQVSTNDFIVPLFAEEGTNVKRAIDSMPNQFRYSEDLLLTRIEKLMNKGLKSFLLFVKVGDELKDNEGKEAYNDKGLMPQIIRSIKKHFPESTLMTDVALDPYSSFGHDGIVIDGEIVNDPTVDALVKMSICHARAGADFVAPSDMMDGRIGAIRTKLDEEGFTKTGIMSYSAKYASAWYGPFRDALDSEPGFGDKSTYQMDYRNSSEAFVECQLDYDEGADILMIKPAGNYLDIIAQTKANFEIPVAAYQVSGEYSMIHAAAEKGWIDLEKAMLESLYSIKRAGADMIASYFAEDFVGLKA